jgi:hypothetical protein
MSVAANPYIRPAAIEDLVPIGRAVRVMTTATAMLLLVMLVTAATTAAAIAAATRPLPIVWSH